MDGSRVEWVWKVVSECLGYIYKFRPRNYYNAIHVSLKISEMAFYEIKWAPNRQKGHLI